MKICFLSIIIYILIFGLIRYKEKRKLKAMFSAIFLSLCILIGGRIVWYICERPHDLSKLFSLNLSSVKIIGGLIGGLLGILLLCLIFKKEKRNILNTSIEAMFLGGGFSKLGCFLAGCCLGKTTSFIWTICYPENGLYDLIPVTLYETIVLWSCFWLLHILKETLTDKTRISLVIAIYVVIRAFILEHLYAGATSTEVIVKYVIYAIIILICAILIFMDRKNNYKKKLGKKKAGLIVLSIIGTILVVVLISVFLGNKDDREERNAELEEALQANIYYEVLENGITINTSKELLAEKNFNELTISNVELTSKNDMNTFRAEVSNSSDSVLGGYSVDVTFIEKDGDIIATITGYIEKVESNESVDLIITTTRNIINSYDFYIEEK